jgi:hypothetical protein
VILPPYRYSEIGCFDVFSGVVERATCGDFTQRRNVGDYNDG